MSGAVSARFAFFSLLPILGLFPPETRGESLAGAAALVALLTFLCWPGIRGRGQAQALLVIGLALAGVAARAGVAPLAAVEPVALVVLAFGAALVAATVATDRSFASTSIRILAVVGSAAAAHGIYQKLWGLARLADLVAADPSLPDRAAVLLKLEAGRAFAGFSTPAALGGFLALSLPLALAAAAGVRGGKRVLWALAAALQVGGLAVTASVTAVAALGAASLLALLVWKRARITLAVALAALLLLLVAVTLQRGALLDPRDPASPSRQRVANWRSAWEVASDHPWLGVGPGAFAEASLAKRQPGDNEARHAHDLPLELAAEIGWPGAVLASGAFFALFLAPLWREQGGEPWRRAAAIGLASFALHNLADFTFVMPSILWTAAILRGLLARPVGPDAGPCWLRATALGAMVAAALAASLGGLGRESRLAARVASHAGDHGLALELATRALTLAPWDIDSAVAVAAASAADRSALALEHAERAVRMAPTRGAARELRARARLAAGDAAGALADWERAGQLDPERAEYARAKDAVRRALRIAYR